LRRFAPQLSFDTCKQKETHVVSFFLFGLQ